MWRNHLLPWWRDYRWPVIGALWVLTALLGYLGFAYGEKPEGEPPWTILGTLYASLQLFTLESGSGLGNGVIPWQLELARWLAPFVTAFTAAEVLAAIFYDHLQRFRLRWTRDHVVICGLGQKGLLLARTFRALGHSVVVIEQDEGCDRILACREEGAAVLIGNASERKMLEKAGVAKARYLLSVCGDDGANAEVAAHACELVQQRKEGVLVCVAHILDPALWHLLRTWEINTVEAFRLQFFNVFETGARTLLSAHPPFQNCGLDRTLSPHLLVVGAGRFGQSLIRHAARNWQEECAAMAPPHPRLHLTVIDQDTTQIKEWLRLRHPEIESFCDITTRSMDVRSPEFHRADFLFDKQGGCSVTAAYICVNDDALGLSAALALQQRVRGRRIPIVVRMIEDAGLASLLHRVGDGSRGYDNVAVFGLLERTCQPDLVLGSTTEVLARAIHEKYVRDQTTAGETRRSNSALVAWEDLPEEIREVNRTEADHIGRKLQMMDCDIAPLADWNAAAFTFTPEEIEEMARREHERWLEERRAAGWTYGERDPARKTNPNMQEWERLSEESRQFNREAVRDLPAFLARAGFQIYRLNF